MGNNLSVTISLKNFFENYLKLNKSFEWDYEKNEIDHRTLNFPFSVQDAEPKNFFGVSLSTAFEFQAVTAVREAINIQGAKRLSSRILDFIEIVPLQIFGYRINGFDRGGMIDAHLDSDTMDVTLTFYNPVEFIIDASQKLGIPCIVKANEELYLPDFKQQLVRCFNFLNYLNQLPADPFPLFNNSNIEIVADLFKAEVLSLSEYEIGECIWNFVQTNEKNYDAEKLKIVIMGLVQVTGLDKDLFENCLGVYLKSGGMSKAS